MSAQRSSDRHRLLDNITDLEPEDFFSCRDLVGELVRVQAHELWTDAMASVPKGDLGDDVTELDRYLGVIYHMSLLTEILNVTVLNLLTRKFGRELALRYIKDCWLGKAAENLHEHFPEISVNVVLRDDPNQRPDVPPLSAGGPG